MNLPCGLSKITAKKQQFAASGRTAHDFSIGTFAFFITVSGSLDS